jgi:hypothetical protein
VAGELSELLRRIAMARFGRRDCAGLSGEAWLDWLSEKDPSGFDWATQGQVLLRLPYAPEGDAEDAKAVRVLIDAALRLVSHSREDALRHRPAGGRPGAPTGQGRAGKGGGRCLIFSGPGPGWCCSCRCWCAGSGRGW